MITLYIKIPHAKLKEKVVTFIRKVFTGVEDGANSKKYVCCSDKSRPLTLVSSEARLTHVIHVKT